MSHRHDTWGWMLAVDFFFAGMGGAMLCIAGIADLFGHQPGISPWGHFLGPLCVAAGACFLLIELGRPFQGWRVFMNPKAILTFGAWNMLIAILGGLWYASFSLAGLPWTGSLALRRVLAVICLLAGFIVATYPGVLLGRHKSRPFWMGTGMMVLFCLSSFVTGFAAHLLCGQATGGAGGLLDIFASIIAVLLALQLVFWPVYLWIKTSGATRWEAEAARRWLQGDLAGAFKYGFLLLGTLVPLLLFLLPGSWDALGAALVLLGGLIMRLLVVRAGEERTWLPGQRLYYARLPVGTEEFLKAWDNH